MFSYPIDHKLESDCSDHHAYYVYFSDAKDCYISNIGISLQFHIFRFANVTRNYVSRANEIEIRPSSVRPSVRPSSVCGIDYLWSYCMDCFQISVVAFPGSYAQKFFFDFLGFFFFVFVNMGPYGSQNFKRLLLPQITFESFQTLSEISSQWSSQKFCFGFWNFEFLIFYDFFPLR